MSYQFDYDWGESWKVTEEGFVWNREYWVKAIARHISFFREKVREVKDLPIVLDCIIWCDEKYIGTVSVSDHYVHYIMEVDNDERMTGSWLVEEL